MSKIVIIRLINQYVVHNYYLVPVIIIYPLQMENKSEYSEPKVSMSVKNVVFL